MIHTDKTPILSDSGIHSWGTVSEDTAVVTIQPRAEAQAPSHSKYVTRTGCSVSDVCCPLQLYEIFSDGDRKSRVNTTSVLGTSACVGVVTGFPSGVVAEAAAIKLAPAVLASTTIGVVGTSLAIAAAPIACSMGTAATCTEYHMHRAKVQNGW